MGMVRTYGPWEIEMPGMLHRSLPKKPLTQFDNHFKPQFTSGRRSLIVLIDVGTTDAGVESGVVRSSSLWRSTIMIYESH